MRFPHMGFLFDIDNTLLDNDRITDDLRGQLEPTVGHDRQETYWAIRQAQIAYLVATEKNGTT